VCMLQWQEHAHGACKLRERASHDQMRPAAGAHTPAIERALNSQRWPTWLRVAFRSGGLTGGRHCDNLAACEEEEVRGNISKRADDQALQEASWVAAGGAASSQRPCAHRGASERTLAELTSGGRRHDGASSLIGGKRARRERRGWRAGRRREESEGRGEA
jgi:hypothetical protein